VVVLLAQLNLECARASVHARLPIFNIVQYWTSSVLRMG